VSTWDGLGPLGVIRGCPEAVGEVRLAK
jgi:hypothetical protein